MTQPPRHRRPGARRDKNQPLVDDIRLLGRILGDVIREQEGDGGLRPGRAHPQAVGRLPAATPTTRRPRARPAAQEPVGRPDGERDPRLHLLQPPGQPRRGPAPHPPPRRARARRRHRRKAARRCALARLRRAGIGAERIAADAGAQPTSRRCSPPTRPRCSARASSTPSAAIAELLAARDDRALSAARRGAQRGADPRPRHAAVADAPAALHQADGGRRDRERAQLLRRHLPARDSRAVRRARARRCRAIAIAPFLRMGHWIGGDRDGNPTSAPRRCDTRCARQSETGAAPLPDRGALARRRAVAARRRWSSVDAGDAGAGRALARRQRAPRRRALPPRADRHVCAAGRHAAGAHRRRGRAPRGGAAEPVPQRRGVPRRPAHRSRSRCAAPRRGAGRAAPGAADPRGGGVRLPPRHASTCGRARTSTRRWSPSCWRWRASRPTTRRSPRPPRASLLLQLLDDARPLRVRGAARTAKRRRGELAIFEAARDDARALRRDGDPPLHHLATPRR